MKIRDRRDLEKARATDGRHSVQGIPNLYMAISGASKRWTYKYNQMVDGKNQQTQVTLGFAVKDAMSLDAAKAEAVRLRTAHKIDKVVPTRVKPAAAQREPTFAEDAIVYHAKKQGGWKSEAYRKEWLAGLERHIFPSIGKLATSALRTADVKRAMEGIWGKLETADVILDRIKQVWDFASADEDRSFPPDQANPANQAAKRLPDLPRHVDAPHGSIPFAEVPAFYAKLVADGSVAANALRFLLLCCTPRAAEIYNAQWEWIEGDNMRVPAEFMKSGVERVIPLSKQALAVLDEIAPRHRTGYLFRTVRRGKWLNGAETANQRRAMLRKGGVPSGTFQPFAGHIQDDAMRLTLQRLHGGIDPRTKTPYDTHGLRATFRGWVKRYHSELGQWGEAALDHVVGSRTERAYERNDHALPDPQRRFLADAWGSFVVTRSE